MSKWECEICGYIYDPSGNDNVKFEDLPENWLCPECNAGKDQFQKFNWYNWQTSAVGLTLLV